VSLPRVVVLASGNGSNLQALVDAAGEGRISGRIAAVISDRPESGALARAASASIPAVALPPDPSEARVEYDRRLAGVLADLAPDLVVLAGWMRILTETVVTHFRVINLHPALPGELPGTGAIERAWAEFLSGARTRSGVMVHEVPDAAVDAGPVLAHEEVAFEAGDDLDAFARRMHTVEHHLLVEVVADICAALRTDNPQNVSQEVIDVRTG
jgi:phosphoribosylglycinamide formyltransferase-1